MTDKPKFEFFLNKKKHIVVLSFLGTADLEVASTLQECQNELLILSAKFVIMNMAGVTDIAKNGYSPFIKLQAGIREKGKILIVCALSHSLERKLKEDGVVRSGEVADSLVSALQQVAIKGET